MHSVSPIITKGYGSDQLIVTQGYGQIIHELYFRPSRAVPIEKKLVFEITAPVLFSSSMQVSFVVPVLKFELIKRKVNIPVRVGLESRFSITAKVDKQNLIDVLDLI